MKVLTVHPTGSFGGASKSIMTLQQALLEKGCRFKVICPSGSAAERFLSLGYEVVLVDHISQFDNTRFGFYRKLRWVVLLREFFFLWSSYNAIKREVFRGGFDVINLNEITLLPWAKIIGRWTDAPVIVHVRSLQRRDVSDIRSKFIHKFLKNDVATIIAIDETVRRSLPKGLPAKIIHNSLQLNDFRPSDKKCYRRFRVAIVGVLLKLKGVYEFLRAARTLVHEKGYDIEFYIVGENARKLSGLKAAVLKKLDLAHDVKGDIDKFVITNCLEKNVVLTGFVEDVQSIYADLDVLCFPSHLNAAGRPVFEAAFFGVPSIVAVKNPPPDTIIDGETGLCIDEPDAELLAAAIERLFNNRGELKRLGENARELAHRNFDVRKNADALLQVYKNAISGHE